MGVPYHLTEKISVYNKNMDRRNRERHLAYLICYHNSYRMRRLMMKSEDGDKDDYAEPQHVLDDDNHEMRREVADSRSNSKPILPEEATVPYCFEQVCVDVFVGAYWSTFFENIYQPCFLECSYVQLDGAWSLLDIRVFEFHYEQ